MSRRVTCSLASLSKASNIISGLLSTFFLSFMEGMMAFIRRYWSLMFFLRLASESVPFSRAVSSRDSARGSLSSPRPLVSVEVSDSVGEICSMAFCVFFFVVRVGAMPMFVVVVVVVVVSVPLLLPVAVVVFVLVLYRCGSGSG